MNLLNKISITQVILDDKFKINPYLNWFDLSAQQTIAGYYHYRDQLIAFTSNLLKNYYLPDLCNISNLIINYTTHHKPYISQLSGITVQFNIAHCYNRVILAVYEGNDYYIGVDIEKIDNSINVQEMSMVVFSSAERKLINNSAINFFKLWTKKEALIKALGTGFATDFYQDTALNLDDCETSSNYHIVTRQIDDYFLSVCLHKI